MFVLGLIAVYSFNFVPDTELKKDGIEKMAIGENVKRVCKYIFNGEFLPYMIFSFYCINH